MSSVRARNARSSRSDIAEFVAIESIRKGAESVLVRLALQAELDAAGLKYKVEIEAA